MVVSARAGAGRGCFDVDLGNRVLELCTHGVASSERDDHVRCWLDALVTQEVLAAVPDEACSHRAKFWKTSRPLSRPRPMSAVAAVASRVRRTSLTSMRRPSMPRLLTPRRGSQGAS